MGLSATNELEDQYKVPLIAKLLHSLPHYNITFHRTNNTFRPTDEVYLEVSAMNDIKLCRHQTMSFAMLKEIKKKKNEKAKCKVGAGD